MNYSHFSTSTHFISVSCQAAYLILQCFSSNIYIVLYFCFIWIKGNDLTIFDLVNYNTKSYSTHSCINNCICAQVRTPLQTQERCTPCSWCCWFWRFWRWRLWASWSPGRGRGNTGSFGSPRDLKSQNPKRNEGNRLERILLDSSECVIKKTVSYINIR